LPAFEVNPTLEAVLGIEDGTDDRTDATTDDDVDPAR
jgi:hypothetical protein